MTETTTARVATLFTPESANRALPYVRAVVEDYVEAVGRIRRADEVRKRAHAGSPAVGATQAERDEALRRAEEDRRAAKEAIARLGRELESVGVELKEPEIGLVDFPGEIEGRRVCLCWKRGEATVAWWHDVGAGYRGRRPLPLPLPPTGEGAPR